MKRAGSTTSRKQRSAAPSKAYDAATTLVRPASREDLPAIVDLFARDDLHRSYVSHGSPLGQGYERAFDEIANDPDNHVLVAECAGRVVGTFQLTFIRQLTYQGALIAQLESVFVHPDARSLGIGSVMMAWAIGEARRRGCLRVQLTSNLLRSRAHQFYARLGFEASHSGMKLYLNDRSASTSPSADTPSTHPLRK